MSRNNAAADPAFALTLNPFNSDATVNLVVGALNGGGDADLAALSKSARGMISASPADARGYSILGAIEDKAGNGQEAQALYSVALAHSKSELQALLRTAEIRLQASDTVGALESIDLLLRRWPTYWEQVQPVLQGMAASPDTSDMLARELNGLPPWRSRAIAALSKAPATLAFLRDLIAMAPAEVRSSPGWAAERDTVVAALVNNKAYPEAYSLFLSTLTEEEASVAGYIFDSRFSLQAGGGYFGWRVQRAGATEVALGDQTAMGGTGLRVRFLDSPARPGIVSQNLMLPFGKYRLAVEASGSGLKAPKDLFWSLRCADGPSLATLSVPSGISAKASLQVDFDVPESCGRQVLSLDTLVKTESWRDRYQGEVRFRDLVITRL